jgi:uncharacterized membrane protein YoaT (DUF817 family)
MPSRVLSLAVLAVAYLRAWHIGLSGWYVTLLGAPLLLLIWFPREVDEFTYGAWTKGNRIDSHTPAVLIAGFGWILLVLITMVLFVARIVSRSP